MTQSGPLLAQQGQSSTPTQYQFVPGSRQARVVTGTPSTAQASSFYAIPAGQAAQTGVTGMQYHGPLPASYYAHPARQPPLSSMQQRQSTAPAKTNTATKAKAFDFVDHLTVDGASRLYRVHIPPAYDRSRPAPVVLAFHGIGMNSMAMMMMSGFNGLADRKNFIVVYGEGLNNKWNDGNGAGPDDIGYVSALLEKLSHIANIDRRRIYACGISNGGFFSERLACAMPEQIAAVGVVSSTMMASSQTSGGNPRLPIIFFLGTEDPLLPWGDGRNKALGKLGESLGLGGLGSIDSPLARMGGLLSVPETIQFWTNHNGCAGSPNVVSMPDRDNKDGTTVKKETYGSGDVVVYVIEGGGHTWPGMINIGSVKDLCGATSQDIDASEIMWDFFQRYSR